ncbi:hypothetical protein ACKVMT_13305 [Halobacteriales archaeon Cl-PHB]
MTVVGVFWQSAVALLHGLGRAFTDAYETSVLYRLSRTLDRWTRHAWLYRWLTSEPDPEVVVIDLRETHTIGPILRLLDRVAASRPARWLDAQAATFGGRTTTIIRQAPLKSLSGVFVGLALTQLALSVVDASVASPGLWLLVLAVATLGTRVDASWETLAESRIGRALTAAFVPPEPPEDDDPLQ